MRPIIRPVVFNIFFLKLLLSIFWLLSQTIITKGLNAITFYIFKDQKKIKNEKIIHLSIKQAMGLYILL
jgi:hypothetical protein